MKDRGVFCLGKEVQLRGEEDGWERGSCFSLMRARLPLSQEHMNSSNEPEKYSLLLVGTEVSCVPLQP